MKQKIICSLIGILVCTLYACTDDRLIDEGSHMPEGETSVTASVEFVPFRKALDTNTRSAGDAIKDIDDLCVLLYDKDKNFMQSYYLLSGNKENTGEFEVSDVDRTDANAEGGKTAEAKTKRATFKLDEISYGYYYMYAVANMGNLAEQEDYKEKIKTIDGLKSIRLKWETDWLGEQGKKAVGNNQMFGFFTKDGSHSQNEQVAIDKKDMKLHAWIRRAASKVTVAYDAGNLKEGVFIYLKSVRIKDIPANCYLGKTNTPAKQEELLDGETIKYYQGNDVPAFNEYYPVRLSTGKSYYPWPVEKPDGTFDKGHEEASDALFFFENMQGAGKDMPDKRQDADGDGKLDFPGVSSDDSGYRPKDGVPYGTYIEVDAYYVSVNQEKVGSGDIKYRFMLGKDVINDYDAERNHHYKLTLKFKNFANEADWHIEYDEPEPGIEAPSPYYISYLYNRQMEFPIKINPGNYTVQSVKAEIINNGWSPYGADANGFDYHHFDVDGDNKWNGFLSLRRTTATILVNNPNAPLSEGVVYASDNKTYYDQTQRGERDYDVSPGLHEDAKDGNYSVRREEGSNILHMSIPMYTRAKQMISSTGYTGNNPYVAYQRHAKVKITVQLSGGGEPLTEVVDVFQVRRVVNPKGIYRRHDNSKPFNVVLKRLPRENATEFEDFPSEGPWEAVVAASTGGNFISLEKDGKRYNANDTLKGLSGSHIDFKVLFNGTCSEQESRHAVVRVSYHNKTCNHLIFIRQGYAPVALLDNGRAWHASNMRTATEEADSPVEEGSLFKWGNLDEPIDASNNKHDNKPYWINVSPEDFKDDGNKLLKIAGKAETKVWKDISSQSATVPFATPVINNKQAEVANFEDYELLYESKDIEMGYGVLYGDDADGTLSDINEVYGYRQGGSGTYGMRGCFIYNKNDGRNLFFPIGASGYGHRKQGRGDIKTGGIGDIHGETDKEMVLRYAAGRGDRYTPESSRNDRPLFYDLYMRPGAVYWLQKEVLNARPGDSNFNNVVGWDINYFTFDFNALPKSNVFGTINGQPASDACFIRCVEP